MHMDFGAVALAAWLVFRRLQTASKAKKQTENENLSSMCQLADETDSK